MGAVEIDVGDAGGEFVGGSLEGGAGENGDAGVFEEFVAEGGAGGDFSFFEFIGEVGEIGKQVEAADGSVDFDAGIFEDFGGAEPDAGEDAPDVPEVSFDDDTADKSPDGGVLDGGTDGGVGFAGDRSHGVKEPIEGGGKGEGAESPASGTAPFGDAGGDDGAFGIEAGDGYVFTGVVELPVDFVGKDDQFVLAGDFSDFFEVVGGIGQAVGIGRVIQDKQAGSEMVVFFF